MSSLLQAKIKVVKVKLLKWLKKKAKNPRVVVAGVNIVKKHIKPSAQNPQGGIVEREASLHISNVALIDKNGKATRIGYKLEGDKKVRVAKTTGETF